MNNNLLKSLGLLLIILGALILIVCYATECVDTNAITGSSLLCIVLGIIVHIVMNKRIQD